MARQTYWSSGYARSSREVPCVNTGCLHGLLWVVVLVALLGPGAAHSQAQDSNDYLTAIGIYPWTTTMPVEHGHINIANGDFHLEIPVGSFPQRPGRNLTLSLQYDSRIWHVPVWPFIWFPDNVTV